MLTSPFVGATWTASALTSTSTACTVATNLTNVDRAWTFTASALTAGVASGFADVTCGLYQGGVKKCDITGAFTARYRNPAGGTGSVTVTGGVGIVDDVFCPINSTTVRTDHLAWTITTAIGGPAPHTGPVLVRTA